MITLEFLAEKNTIIGVLFTGFAFNRTFYKEENKYNYSLFLLLLRKFFVFDINKKLFFFDNILMIKYDYVNKNRW